MFHIANAVKYVLRQHILNVKRIFALSFSHAKKQTVRTSLGIWWTVIRDLVYFAALTAFRYLLAGNATVDNMHFTVYLILGLVPWFFMNEVISGGALAINMNKPIVESLIFPAVILPTIEATAIFIKRLFTLTFIFIILYIFEDLSRINYLLVLYYFIAMYFLMIAYNLFISAFIAISKDFNQLYATVTRILMFFMPILWTFEMFKSNLWLTRILKSLPFTYIIMGFRDAFIVGGSIPLFYTIYFWVVTLLLFVFGSIIQYKFRKFYADFI